MDPMGCIMWTVSLLLGVSDASPVRVGGSPLALPLQGPEGFYMGEGGKYEE